MAVALPGDTDNNLLKKIADNTNALTSGGGGAASNVAITGISVTLPVSGPATDAQMRASALPVSGPLTDTQLRASAVPISVASLPLPSGAATESTLGTLNGKVTACNTGAVVLAAGAAAIGSVSVTGSVTVAQATASNLKVDLSGTAANSTAIKVDGSAVTQPVSGNVGGKSTAIKDTTAVSTSPAYSIGDAVGGKRTFANALTSVGTGVLESITVLDRANQSSPLTIIIFDADPTNATITDNAAFVYSTDDLKVLGQISVSASDYVTTNSKAVATIKGIGLTLKSSGTSLYMAVVTTSTPTFAATTDVQIILGILQD